MIKVSVFITALALISSSILSNAYIRPSEPRIVLSKAQCGKREYYNECGSRCAPACRQFDKNCYECVAGCFCKKPFLRSVPGGPCVRICPTHFRHKHHRKPHKRMRLQNNNIESTQSSSITYINTTTTTTTPKFENNLPNCSFAVR